MEEELTNQKQEVKTQAAEQEKEQIKDLQVEQLITPTPTIVRPGAIVPNRVFFTKGVGVHKDRLRSFEIALRKAGIAECNLVAVSSIVPPRCKIISPEQGMKLLTPGQITYTVLAKNETDEPNRLVAASIGMAIPADPDHYGYLSEHHSYGETDERAGEYSEDLAATMLASIMDIDFDPDKAWDERKQEFVSSGRIIRTRNITQSAQGNKDGLWTTVLAAAVFLNQEEEKK